MKAGTKVDLILHRARSLASQDSRQRPGAVAVVDGRISALGDDEEILPLAGPETRLIDCNYRTLLPGFIDAHVHLLGYAETFFGVDCQPTRVTSIAALQAQIREQAARTPPGDWIRAYGYHQFFLEEGRQPTRWDLDEAAPCNPVRLLHQNRHLCVLNSLALQRAGITRQTPNLPGGLIERDPDSGEPTGLLVGMYQWLSDRVLPPLAPEELREGVKLASASFLSQGVSCIHDASPRNGMKEWNLYQQLSEKGDLAVRLRMMLGLEGLAEALEEGLEPHSGDSQFCLGPVKLIVEQVGGKLYPSPSDLADQVRRVHEAGFQTAIHAITPRATAAALKAISSLGEGEGRRRRHRIEHCTYLSPKLVRDLGEAGVVVVSQPSFIFYNGMRYLAEVPPEKFSWVCRGQSLLRAGVPLVGSTDSPVVPNSILTGLGTAVTRESQVGFVFGPRELLSPSQAVNLFTVAGAYASFEEGEMGSLTAGNLADLVLLDQDPLEVQPEEIRTIRPQLTVVGGKVAWERADQEGAGNRS